MKRRSRTLLASIVAAVAVVSSCNSSSSSSTNGGSTSGGGRPIKGGTFTILANSSFGVADPAQGYSSQEWQLLIDTHDGLLQFRRVGGPAGTVLVPDLAESIPQTTDGGKTYLFHVRRGIRFSNGQVMKPSDFVRTFERQFTVPGPTTFYSGIVGAGQCTNATKTQKCDLTRGVVANDSNYTLTIHLTKPDPEFLDKLAMPFAYAVPGNTSLKLLGNNVPPGTGPYMWKSYNPNAEAVLVRNPYFHLWDAEAQPPGNPNEIVQKYGLPITDEVTQVENGSADEVFDGNVIPADRLNELDSPRYAGQLHVHPLTDDFYFALNTTRPPFNNEKARQAINYAADRSAYVKIAGGPSLGVPTCQILPPNFPGYVPYCPYTAGSNHTKWKAPDILKAKQLVKESRTTGMKVVVNSGNDGPSMAFAVQMASDLRRIGYQATTQFLSNTIQQPYVENSANHSKWNVALAAWAPDYPAASDFLNVLLGCGSIHPGSDASPNIAAYCNAFIQAKMDHAEVVGQSNPTAANKIWAQVDHDLTDEAPLVDLVNPRQIDFLSARVHGYQWNPQWNILIDQTWLR